MKNHRYKFKDVKGKRLYLLPVFFLALLFHPLTSVSQTLNNYLHTAAENNPEVKAYFNDYLADMERVPQVGALPDPELTIGYFIRPMERFMGNQRADIQLMQMFPWFGMLGTQKDEASKMAMARYRAFQDVKNRLFYQVKSVWYEMYRLEEEIKITEENLEILNNYERLALVRFQSAGTGAGAGSSSGNAPMPAQPQGSSGSNMGSMGGSSATGNAPRRQATGNSSTMQSAAPMGGSGSGMSDVLQVRLEVRELENTLALLKDSRRPLRAEFNQLLNRDMNDSIIISGQMADTALSIDRLALLDSITQNNPMLKMLEAEEAAFEVQKRMAKLEGRPMFGAGLNYMAFSPRTENGMQMGGNDMIMPMVRVSIPIYRKKYNALHKEAELKQRAVQLRRENTRNELATQWATSLRDLDDAVRRAAFYRGQTELARQTLSLLMTSYSTGGREFEEVLRVQQQLLGYQLNLITAIVDQHTTVAMLEALAATGLK